MAIPRSPAFSVEEYRARLGTVRAAMAARGLDALLLMGPHNVNYLSGMDSENLFDFQCLIVPIDRDPRLVIFNFEEARAENSCWLSDIVMYSSFEDPVETALTALRGLGLGGARIGVEQRGIGITPANHARIVAGLPDATLSDAFGVVESARLVKSPAELACMRRAAALTDAGTKAAYEAMGVGVRDAEIAAVILDTFYRNGSETVCWGPIVASGFLAGSAHSTFNGRRLQAGDTCFLELTGEVRRYTGPLMRTAILGEPTAEQARIAAIGAEAVQTILRTARAGIPAAEVAKAAHAVLEPILDSVVFHHFFGYPVGLGYPGTWIETLGYFLRVDNPRPLEAGMVFHLPISLRRYGEWGINQSHTIAITETGAEALTTTEARLRVIPI